MTICIRKSSVEVLNECTPSKSVESIIQLIKRIEIFIGTLFNMMLCTNIMSIYALLSFIYSRAFWNLLIVLYSQNVKGDSFSSCNFKKNDDGSRVPSKYDVRNV